MPPWRPGHRDHSVPVPAPGGVRVVLDVRPLQDPSRAPLTAIFLEQLLHALNTAPRPGESFAFLLASDQEDPTTAFPRLEVVGRRLLPPTRLLRAGALTVDPILLRGASVGAGWKAERDGAVGTVYHAAAGAMPIASRIPVVASLLDLAPWELPAAYQRGTASRFGQRLRGRILRDAAAVLVPGEATLVAARKLLHVRRDRLRVVPLAPRAAFRPSAADDAGAAAGSGGAARREHDRLGLPERYFVYAGRYDARQDLATLLAALARLAAEARPTTIPAAVPWPPRVCLVDATPEDRAALSRAAAREGVGELLAYAPRLTEPRLAALVAGARALVLPVRSEAAGLPALEAIAAGVPVVASRVGTLPAIIGPAGLLVEPGDPDRLASALRTAWSDDAVHAGLVAATADRVAAARTWADVATDIRAVWAEVARPAPML